MPTPTFNIPVDPATGDVLGVSAANTWTRNVEYLHGLTVPGYEPFSGFRGFTESPWPNVTEHTIWKGWYIYRGQKYVYNKIVCVSPDLRIYVSHDGGETLIQHMTSAGNATTPINLTGYTFTTGSKYYVRVTLQNPSGGRGEGRVDWAYVPVNNTYTWQTVPAFTDNTISSASDLSKLTNNEYYLKTINEVPKGTFMGGQWESAPNNFTVSTAFNGSFVYLGLDTLNITANFYGGDGVSKVHIVNDDGTNDRIIITVNSGDPYPSTFDLSTCSPSLTIGQRYRLYFDTQPLNVNTGRPDLNLYRVYISGTKALTQMPPRWSFGDYGNGSTGTPRFKWVADALTDLRALSRYQTISGSDHGYQELSSDISISPGTGSSWRAFYDFRRVRHYRWLMYKPSGAGVSGTLTYGTGTATLPDVNGDASWCVFDLDTLPLLPLGFIYQVTGVSACFESQTSS